MGYIMIFCLAAAIAILVGSIVGYLKIKNYLKSEIYNSDRKYNVISNIYIILIIFFIIAYMVCLAAWIRHPEFNRITYVVFSLLFFGSIFVGLSVLVLKQSLDVVLGIKLNEIDTMTGLMTKRSFEMKAQKILDEGNGYYVLSVIDMDNFKTINDVQGHGKGDEMIHATAEVIKNNVRSQDMVGRFGGDEFLILFHGIREREVHLVMNRITQAIVQEQRNRKCANCDGISYGVSAIKGGSGKKYQEIFEQADKDLYRMKKEKNKEGNVG